MVVVVAISSAAIRKYAYWYWQVDEARFKYMSACAHLTLSKLLFKSAIRVIEKAEYMAHKKTF